MPYFKILRNTWSRVGGGKMDPREKWTPFGKNGPPRKYWNISAKFSPSERERSE